MERSQSALSISVKFNMKNMNGKKFRTRILFSVLSVRSSYGLDRKNAKYFHVRGFFSYLLFDFKFYRNRKSSLRSFYSRKIHNIPTESFGVINY